MKIAKLFAYLALAILLPLWLYNLSNSELKETKKTKDIVEKTKNENEKLIAAILANKQGKAEINFNSNHLDSLFYLIAKSNQKTRQDDPAFISRDLVTERELQDLIKISFANATILQGFLSNDKLINNTVSLSDTNRKYVESDLTYMTDFPVYDLSEKGPFRCWKIKLRKEKYQQNKKYFLIFNNTSQTDTVYINRILPAENTDTVNLFNLQNDTTISIYPKNQFVIEYYSVDNKNRIYYVEGLFRGKTKKRKEIYTKFKIPLIIERHDLLTTGTEVENGSR